MHPTTLSGQINTDPYAGRCVMLAEPRALTVTIEERYPLDQLVLLISYGVRVRYTSPSEYDVVGFDLVCEKRDLSGKLITSAVPLEHITDVALQMGLRSMLGEDVLSPEVVEMIDDAIVADMRKHDEIAREYAAEIRGDLPVYAGDDIDF